MTATRQPPISRNDPAAVFCDACGTPNRANANFCIGCANRMPTFAASGPSALEAMDALRPPARVPFRKRHTDGASNGGGAASSVHILPAEAPAFWIKLGLVGVAMIVAFMLWYLYVTRSVRPAELPAWLAQMVSPDRPQKSLPDARTEVPNEAVASPSAPAETEQAQTATATKEEVNGRRADSSGASPSPARNAASQAASPAPEAGAEARTEQSRTSAAASTSQSTPAREMASTSGDRERARAQEAERQARQRRAEAQAQAQAEARVRAQAQGPAQSESQVQSRSQAPQARFAAQSPAGSQPSNAPAPSYGTPQYSRTERMSPQAAAIQRSLALARGDDGAPPAATGPGPQYDRSRMPQSAPQTVDGGPPVVPGPGPVYDSRAAERASSRSSGDSGPPIAVGPGPLIDYSTPGASPR